MFVNIECGFWFAFAMSGQLSWYFEQPKNLSVLVEVVRSLSAEVYTAAQRELEDGFWAPTVVPADDDNDTLSCTFAPTKAMAIISDIKLSKLQYQALHKYFPQQLPPWSQVESFRSTIDIDLLPIYGTDPEPPPTPFQIAITETLLFRIDSGTPGSG